MTSCPESVLCDLKNDKGNFEQNVECTAVTCLRYIDLVVLSEQKYRKYFPALGGSKSGVFKIVNLPENVRLEE